MLAIILSASAAVINTWGAFYDYRWFWATYTTTLIALYAISDDLEYEMASGDGISQDRINFFYSRLQNTLREAATSWSQKRMQEAVPQQLTAR